MLIDCLVLPKLSLTPQKSLNRSLTPCKAQGSSMLSLFTECCAIGSRKEEMRGLLASWPARHKICLGIAHGLHYLHAMAHPRVIHRDIKAGNVLLNRHLEAKIADFGLALLFPEEQSRIMTLSVAGTK